MQVGEKARESIKNGINIVADAVKETFGVGGRTVVIPSFMGGYGITKDGVSVAKAVILDDEYENIIASIVKDASIKTNNEAGDGSSTSMILTQAIYNEVLKQQISGRNLNTLLKGVDSATKDVLKALKTSSIEVDDKMLKNVASISANNDEALGEIISDVYKKVGKDGVVTIEGSESSETYVEMIKGMSFDGNLISRLFTQNSNMENVYVATVNYKIERVDEISSLLEQIVTKDKRPILFIVDDMSFDVQDALHQNQNYIKSCVIKANVYGDKRNKFYEDISKYVGCKLFSIEDGTLISSASFEDLGKCDRIKIDGSKSVVVGGKGENIEEYISLVEQQGGSDVKERIASLKESVGVIKLGASTKTEFDEKIDRVEDAINATKSALLEGVIPGGGIALLKIATNFLKEGSFSTDEEIGRKALYEAIMTPSKLILSNSGLSEHLIDNVKEDKFNIGWDVASNSKKDFIKVGIIDPVKVTRVALENASSVARTLLSSNVIIK